MQSLFPASCTKQVALHTSPFLNVQNITLGVELAFLIDIDQRPETGSNWGWLPPPGTDFKDSFGPNQSFLQLLRQFRGGRKTGHNQVG